MVLKVTVTKADANGVTLDVLNDDTRIKTLEKKYSSFDALYGLVSRWYKGKSFTKVPTIGGWFSPTFEQVQQTLQKFLDEVIQQTGEDSFPVKSWLRLYDLQGKVVIITGASSGIGKQNAYQMAEMGAHVIMACRSESKTAPIVEDIKQKSGNSNVEYVHLNLESLKSVTKFVEDFKQRNLPLHILLNNAAMITDGVTEYGVDITVGVCHVSPFFLTVGLLDVLKNTPNSKMVIVASEAAKKASNGIPWERVRARIPLHYWNALEAYSFAKLGNVYTAKGVARKMKQEGNSLTAYSLHPGVVATDVWRTLPNGIASFIKRFMLNEEEGSLMSLFCCLAAKDEDSGSFYDYYVGGAPENPQFPKAVDEAEEEKCWVETEKICGLRN